MMLKRFGLFVVVMFLLTACALVDLETLPTGGTMGAMRASLANPVELGAFNVYLNLMQCEGILNSENGSIWISFQAESEEDAFGLDGKDQIFLFRGSTSLVGEATTSPNGNLLGDASTSPNGNFHFNCAGAGEITAIPIQSADEPIWVVEIIFAQVADPSGEALTKNVTIHGILSPSSSMELSDTAVLTNNENITEVVSNFQCAGAVIPGNNYAAVTFQMELADNSLGLERDAQFQGLMSLDDGTPSRIKRFNCEGQGVMKTFNVWVDDKDLYLVELIIPELTLDGAEGRLVVMSGGSTIFTAIVSE